ncbi:hypothetical protein GCM10018779_33670 [Streptomyces griseocarneus]|nr:hypothetical protein GCM10018779_33670 [Streptomyces griseocarneus]
MVDSEGIAIRVAELASFRFARPRRTVCSCSTSGRRHIWAARPAGTATMPRSGEDHVATIGRAR